MMFQSQLERKGSMYLSKRSIDNRKKMPTMFEAGKLQISEKVAWSRREETYEAALEVHGGEMKSAEVGLIDAVLSKCSKETIGEVLSSSNKVLPKLYKGPLKNFEASEENMIRSISIYYEGGIMGNHGHWQVYRNVSFQKSKKCRKKYQKHLTVNSCPIPLLVP